MILSIFTIIYICYQYICELMSICFWNFMNDMILSIFAPSKYFWKDFSNETTSNIWRTNLNTQIAFFQCWYILTKIRTMGKPRAWSSSVWCLIQSHSHIPLVERQWTQIKTTFPFGTPWAYWQRLSLSSVQWVY